MTTRQTSVQLTPNTERQVDALKDAGFGTFTDIVRLAVDRLYQAEIAGRERAVDIRTKAQHRVDEWDQLRAHEDTIMYDWPEGDEHWEWVCKAPVAEIVEWAESVERDANAS